MRKKYETKMIRVSKETHKMLTADKNNFEKSIGGGIWSFDDTIREYRKIIEVYQK